MNIRKMTSAEIEKMSHLDIAYTLLKEEKSTYTTVDLLKEICNLLKYSENAFEELIGDFYTSLNLDKRFILIDGKWDLTENHSVKLVVEDELDDDLEEYEDMDEEENEEVEVEDDIVMDDTEALEDVEDDLDDEMEDLTILTEEDMDEENL